MDIIYEKWKNVGSKLPVQPGIHGFQNSEPEPARVKDDPADFGSVGFSSSSDRFGSDSNRRFSSLWPPLSSPCCFHVIFHPLSFALTSLLILTTNPLLRSRFSSNSPTTANATAIP